MSEFNVAKAALLKCKRLPERAKAIINKANNSIDDLNKDDFKQLWIVLYNFIKEASTIGDTIQDIELLICCRCILNLVHYVIKTKPITCVFDPNHLLNIILAFQTFYTKNINRQFKLEIVYMCCSYWCIISISESDIDLNLVMSVNFDFTLKYIFSVAEMITNKSELNQLSYFLMEYCKVARTLFIAKQTIKFDFIVLNLEKLMKYKKFWETDHAQLIITTIFTANIHQFLKFQKIIQEILPKASKLEAKMYGEMYFLFWTNSNDTMKEFIELRGIGDLLTETFEIEHKSLTLRNYLILFESIQSYKEYAAFNEVLNQIYNYILWVQFQSDVSRVKCNAIDIIATIYPLKIKGGREKFQRVCLKAQRELLDLLKDPCPDVQISAIKGLCSWMRNYWDTFEEDQLNECFSLFTYLIDNSVIEVKKFIFHGFCQIFDEFRLHSYLIEPALKHKIKNIFNDKSEKVRHAFFLFLLKVKKCGQLSKIGYYNFNDIANALAIEEDQNAQLLVDLIIDYFIIYKNPDTQTIIERFFSLYVISRVAFRKLMILSSKHLVFSSACQLILSLMDILTTGLQQKEYLIHNNEIHKIPTKKHKPNSENKEDISYTACSNKNINMNTKTICCMMDCVNCLIIVHHNKFINEIDHKNIEIQNSCTLCSQKLFKFYKKGDVYKSARNLSNLIPLSKLTADISTTHAILSFLDKDPDIIKLQAEEDIDVHKVNSLISTLSMCKRDNKELKNKAKKRVRSSNYVDDRESITYITLINSLLIDLRFQEKILESDVYKKVVYDLMSYLQRVKPAIEKRIINDIVINKLSDEYLIELFLLHNRLYIIYYSHEKCVCIDEIIKQQSSILHWVVKNLVVHGLCDKNEITIKFAIKVIEGVSHFVSQLFLMGYVNKTYMDNYFTFCSSLLKDKLRPRYLSSLMTALLQVSKYLNNLKPTDKLAKYKPMLIKCVCNFIKVLSKSGLKKNDFKLVFGEFSNCRRNLTMLILETYKINEVKFKQVFITLIENIMIAITDHIKKVGSVVLNQDLKKMSFVADQLTMVILNETKFRDYFSVIGIEIFSSNKYKKNIVLLLSAIKFVHILSCRLKPKKNINLNPIIKLLYSILIGSDQDSSILKTTDCSNKKEAYKSTGRSLLIATADKLHISLTK